MGNRRVQMRAGVLMLLSTWLKNCPVAVASFIENEDNLHYLTTQIRMYKTLCSRLLRVLKSQHRIAVDDCGEGTESEQQVLKGLMAFLLLVCLESVEDEKLRCVSCRISTVKELDGSSTLPSQRPPSYELFHFSSGPFPGYL